MNIRHGAWQNDAFGPKVTMPPAQDATAAVGLQQRLSEATQKARAAGATMALWTPGGTVCAAAGFANIEAAISADNHTIFQIGSITKVFTATLLLVLQQESRVDIDKPVSAYLPTFKIAGGPPPATLTVRSLLTYTSGIAGEFFEDFGPDDGALARYVDACADLPLVFEPQTMRGYSSTAYCVAGRVAEVVAGAPFNEALRHHVLSPLGLKRTAFYTHDIARFRTAVGHAALPDGGFEQAKALRLPHAMSPTGASLSMTAEDLLRFGLAHLGHGAPLLQPDLCAAMVNQSHRLPPDDTPVMMGWASVATDKGPLIAAAGQTIEHNAVLGFRPEGDFAIAILANTAGAAQRLFAGLGAELLLELTGAQLQMPTAPIAEGSGSADLARYTGSYTNHTRAEIVAVDGSLEARFTAKGVLAGETTLQLAPVAKDRFTAVPGPGPTLHFLFQQGPQKASHISLGGAVFAACDEKGATRYSSR